MQIQLFVYVTDSPRVTSNTVPRLSGDLMGSFSVRRKSIARFQWPAHNPEGTTLMIYYLFNGFVADTTLSLSNSALYLCDEHDICDLSWCDKLRRTILFNTLCISMKFEKILFVGLCAPYTYVPCTVKYITYRVIHLTLECMPSVAAFQNVLRLLTLYLTF